MLNCHWLLLRGWCECRSTARGTSDKQHPTAAGASPDTPTSWQVYEFCRCCVWICHLAHSRHQHCSTLPVPVAQNMMMHSTASARVLGMFCCRLAAPSALHHRHLHYSFIPSPTLPLPVTRSSAQQRTSQHAQLRSISGYSSVVSHKLKKMLRFSGVPCPFLLYD